MEQINRLVDKANNILVVFKEDYEVDSLAAALVFSGWLGSKSKRFNLVSTNFKINEKISFLDGAAEVRNNLSNLRKFIINLNLKKTGVDEFSYDVSDEQLKIFITPKEGFFEKTDVSTSSTDFRFDLIVVLDSPDIESLGSLYADNREFFYEVPIINIDHHSENEHYGQVNLVDLKAVSTTEVIFEFLKQMSFNIPADLATKILAGMFDKTNSFKSTYLSPRNLNNAAELLSLKADKKKIINSLYGLKTLAVLKLWGRVLARLNQDKSLKLVWSLLSHDDFVKSGASENDIKGAVDELISFISGAEIALVLFEKPAKTGTQELIVYGQLFSKLHDCLELTRIFNGEGSKEFAKFTLSGVKLLEAEKMVIDEIRKRLESY